MQRSRSRGEDLDPDALTIGFARRFATYKRADLLFSDPDRLSSLLLDAERPFQLVLAGKAHPQDEGGKALIQRVIEFARDARSGGRVIFLDDYEMTLARYLVQGVDVWLNTPRRPLEASGRQGMKAALNGVLNCSILDGWWVEGYSPETGFAIGDESVAVERRGAGRRRPRRALRSARESRAARVLRARRERHATAVDRDDAPLDRPARRTVQHEPHGRGIRRRALPARAPRPDRTARDGASLGRRGCPLTRS